MRSEKVRPPRLVTLADESRHRKMTVLGFVDDLCTLWRTRPCQSLTLCEYELKRKESTAR